MQKKSFVFLFVGSILMFCSAGEARRSKMGLFIEPIVGYERVQKLVPTPHTTERLVYGARLAFGIPALSAEAEYTHAEDTENFTSPTLTTTDNAEKLKLGVRSQIKLSRTINFVARAGAQGSLIKRTQNDGVTTTTTEEPLEVDPYAGAGLRVRLGRRSKLEFVAEVTAIIPDINDLDKNEYLVTAGFSARL